MASLEPMEDWPWHWHLEYGNTEKFFVWEAAYMRITHSLAVQGLWRVSYRPSDPWPNLTKKLELWADLYCDPLTLTLESLEANELLESVYGTLSGWSRTYWLNRPQGNYKTATYQASLKNQRQHWLQYLETRHG